MKAQNYFDAHTLSENDVLTKMINPKKQNMYKTILNI